MAPPAVVGNTVTDRLFALSKTLQFAWFLGHLVLLMSVGRYLMSWVYMNSNSKLAQMSYRVAFLAAIASYGIVVYKSFRARAKAGQPPLAGMALLADENIQYLVMSLVWLFMPRNVLALLPYAVYSIFHVATYARSNLIPTLSNSMAAPPTGAPSAQPVTAPNGLTEKIGWFVKEYYDNAMAVVAGLEIATWLRVLFSALMFQRGSWILLLLYTAFLRARFAQNTHVQSSFNHLDSRVNTLLAGQNVPPVARQGWKTIKSSVRQFRDITDAQRYMGGPTQPVAAKKTS